MTTPQGLGSRPEDAACLTDLSQSGVRFQALPDSYAAPGCNRLGTVQISALSGDLSQFGVSNIGPVQCRVASAFGNWARFGVDRAARQILGSPLARIETMGSYACRNIAGSNKRSAHASAEAIDVSGFVLEDGRRITLSGDWHSGSAAEREFLRVVHASACKRFGTVLGPEYNRAHADHFHLEGSAAKRSFCR
ncbi:extensin family protein [Qipengyuania nanhaisediminis]|uniref:extensin-like domain-containing protein n=1 Tax=Qipengyuania nanhaisediminis TaxID=604088 RepID=UPI0038B33A00